MSHRLHAVLCIEAMGANRALWLRRHALAAVPIWLQVHVGLLPDLLSWATVLGQAFFGGMAVVFAVLEWQWSRRAASLCPGDPGAPGPEIHTPRRFGDVTSTALSAAFGLISLVPWSCIAMKRLPPPGLLAPLTALAIVVLALGSIVEVVSAGVPALRRRRAGVRSATDW